MRSKVVNENRTVRYLTVQDTRTKRLEYIYRNGVIRYIDLMIDFGLSVDSAESWLKRQKKLNLVVNDQRDEWSISDKGIDYLLWKGIKLKTLGGGI
jgi:hypothetical protein